MHRQKRNLLVLSFLLTAFLLFPAQHVSAKVTVRKPVISSVSGDKNIVSLSWRRVSGAKGYQVFYKEKGRSYRRAASTSLRHYTFYGLKTNTTYYFKIKAWRKSGRKYYYSSYSKVKRFKTNPEVTKQASTLKNFLQNAVKPLGTTLYVWGGGWGTDGNDSHISSRTIGVCPSWKAFFDSQNASYSYSITLYRSELGLDCSGYVGWCLYNTFNTVSGNNGYVELAEHMARDFAKKGWGSYIRRSKVKNWKPGDIMSSDCSDCGHVWISLGTCSDGSVVALHSTGGNSGGVQISGTPTPSGKQKSQAVLLAMKYMNKYCKEWSRRYSKSYASHLKGSSYLSHYCQMRWDVSGDSILTDPENIQKMSPEQVLRTILGSV